MVGEVPPPNNKCPLWYEVAQPLFTAGKAPGFPPPIHPKDGAYFNFETSTDGILSFS
jgi:hypothetical protein